MEPTVSINTLTEGEKGVITSFTGGFSFKKKLEGMGYLPRVFLRSTRGSFGGPYHGLFAQGLGGGDVDASRLTFHQLVVASMMLAMFFPCIAT